MKKSVTNAIALICIATFFSSCATVLGGKVSSCQRHRPHGNEPARKIRVAALIFDIVLWWPGAVIDFATGAIYRPCSGGGYQGTHMGSGNKAYIPDEDDDDADTKEGKGK